MFEFIKYYGSMILDFNDFKFYIERCSDEIIALFQNNKLQNEYKFYLLAFVEASDKKSKVEKYKKVWKQLNTQWQIESFCKGPEIEINIDDNVLFFSMAEIDIDNISKALEIIASNPNMFCMFVSKKDNILSEQFITDISNKGITENNGYREGIDYFNLAINFCPQEDLLIRWWDASEEAVVTLFLKEELAMNFISLSE